MNVKIAGAILAASLTVAPALAPAGEIIGNTYISEQDGVIEITAESWDIKDTESPGQFKLAELTPRQAIGGTTPKIQFFRLPHAGGAIKPEFMIQQMRDEFVKQGMEAGQIETRRINGKRVLTLLVTMTRDGGKASGLVYMLEGEKSLYWAQFFANAAVWDEARQRFDEVMEKVKY